MEAKELIGIMQKKIKQLRNCIDNLENNIELLIEAVTGLEEESEDV